MAAFLTDSWVLWAAVAGLLAYQIASMKTTVLPRLPLVFLALFFLVRIALSACRTGAISLPPPVQHGIDVASMVVLAWAVGRLVFAFAVEFPMRMKGRTLPKITRDFVIVLIFAALAGIVIVFYGDFNPTGIVTTSAIATAILGFGAQGTISSFFSGIVLQMQKPFEIGDWIQFGDFIGKVVSLSWKSTRLLTRDNELIYIPNGDLLGGRILNLTKPNGYHRAAFTVGLEYDAPPNVVRSLVLNVLRQHPLVMQSPVPEVRLQNFGDFSIEYKVLFYTADIGAETRTMAELRNELWYALRRAGIQIPFPIRDVRFAHEERAHHARLAAQRQRELESLLATIPVLAPLSVEEHARLAASVRVCTFGTGETIVREGEDGDSMYIIKSGAGDVFKDAGGTSRQLTTLGVGAYFGEMSLLTGEKRAATVKASGDTDVIVLDKSVFSQLLLGKPEIAAGLADALAVRQQALQSQAAAQQEPAVLRTSLRKRIMTYFGLK